MALLRTILVILIGAAALTSVALFFTTPIDVAPLIEQPAPTEAMELPATTTAAAVHEPAPQAPSQPTVVATPATETTAPAATPAPAAAPADTGVADVALNAAARDSLVNIFCTTRNGGESKPLSGSGVVIDSRGVILTNAHIAQYYLLAASKKVTDIDCIIRTGSPASPRYEAQLLYLPPAWIDANAKKIGDTGAKGTGEHDYALLMVTNTMDGSPPGTLAALPYKKTNPKVGDRMLLAAYPAGFLSGETISEALYPTSAFAYITKLYTFKDPTHADLFSVGGSVVSQAGASGGAAIRADGSLGGIIVTAVLAGSTNERDLRAISIAHIERSLAADGRGSLAQLLAGNLYDTADTFNDDIAPGLIKQLEDGLRD